MQQLLTSKTTKHDGDISVREFDALPSPKETDDYHPL